MVNEAIQQGDENFSKVEFLNAFRSKPFEDTKILSAWKKTGLIVGVDKTIRIVLSSLGPMSPYVHEVLR